MKKMLMVTLALFVASSVLPPPASAQLGKNKGDWMPDQGFWQVVSSPADKQTVTVQFFGFRNRLIYEERLDASHFDPRKRKVRLALNAVLEDALRKTSGATRQDAPDPRLAKKK